MAIQVTGNLANGFRMYLNPKIHLVPHLEYRGRISVDALIVVGENDEVVDSLIDKNIQYPKIEELQPSIEGGNPYTIFIQSLQNYVITKLRLANPNCTFDHF